jgi:putative iron-dependent peroxidase
MKKILESQRVTDYPNNNTIFTVWQFKENLEIKPAFENLCPLLANLNHSFIIRTLNGRSTCVMGVGYEAWNKLSLPTPVPRELKNFEPTAGSKHTAVATPGDLLFHLRGADMSACFDMLTAITGVLSPVADCLEEIHPPGNYDRILDFSKAHTGSLFFAPSLDILNQYSAATN